ncbi:hypothetical protein LCGC14_2714130, partial [marine sediment metagenome]
MTTLEEQINNQKKHVLEQKRQIMEAKAERILENAFRRNDMDTIQAGAPTAEATQKAFESITKTLTKCKEISKQLSVRSRELVRLLTGMEEPSKDSAEKLKKVDSVVLIHVLQDIEVELCQNLSEI